MCHGTSRVSYLGSSAIWSGSGGGELHVLAHAVPVEPPTDVVVLLRPEKLAIT
jgi:hypothetical protein